MYSTMGPRDPHLDSFRQPQHHQQRHNQQQQRMYPSMGTMGANPHGGTMGANPRGNPLWRTQKEVIEVCALVIKVLMYVIEPGAYCMCVINLGADVSLLNEVIMCASRSVLVSSVVRTRQEINPCDDKTKPSIVTISYPYTLPTTGQNSMVCGKQEEKARGVSNKKSALHQA